MALALALTAPLPLQADLQKRQSPKQQAMGNEPVHQVHQFFAQFPKISGTPSSATNNRAPSHRFTPAEDIGSLSAPLALPAPLASQGLKRSAAFLERFTGINPLSLRIIEKHQFFLFMDMRAEFQWASFKMTNATWHQAAEVFNQRLTLVDC